MMAVALRLFWHYLNGLGWWVGWLLTAGGVAGFATIHSAWTTTDEDREFAAHGVRTEARVMLRSEANEWVGPDDHQEVKPRYRLHYHYTDADDTEQVGVAVVPKATWLGYELGDPLAIEYLSDQPARSRAIERERPPLGVAALSVFGVGLLVAVAGLGLLGTVLLRAWRRWRVVRTGLPCLGRITEVVAAGTNGHVHSAPRPPARQLGYTFKDQRGMSHEGRTAALTPDMASRWQLGDPILVLYAPNDIFRHEVDLFGTRAEDLNVLLNRVSP
jgi:hypothetical protein